MGVGSNRRATRDEQLLRDSRSDAEAFGEFYRRNVHLVLALARAEAPTAIAFDITAEVFAKALVAVDGFQGTAPGSARAWLLTIARNQLVDHHRRAATERRAVERLGLELPVLDEGQILELEAEIDANRSNWIEQLSVLPDQERAAVTDHVLGELGYREIADRAGISEVAARKRVSRGLARLRSVRGQEQT